MTLLSIVMFTWCEYSKDEPKCLAYGIKLKY